jgi:hypothetical protein
MRYSPFALALAAAAAACTHVDSDSVHTADLRADIRVFADGSGTSWVFAWLFSHHAGDPPFNEDTIRLVGGDSISATSGNRTVAMQESNLVVEDRYDASFDTADPGQTFEVALHRESDASALHSSAVLPAPFTLSVPATFSRSAPLTISWSPSGSADPITVHFTGCAGAQLGPFPDTGTATLPAGAIPANQGHTNDTCSLAVLVDRTRSGTLDPAYGQGGSIVGIQERGASITSTP